jgi:hypothetical protein
VPNLTPVAVKSSDQLDALLGWDLYDPGADAEALCLNIIVGVFPPQDCVRVLVDYWVCDWCEPF